MDDIAAVVSSGGADHGETRGEKMQALLDDWRATVAKLDELQVWLCRAEEELKGVKQIDQRWKVYREVEAAAERIDKKLEEIERRQDETLTAYLEATGPVTLQLQDGSRRVLAARPQTAGGPADLLPRDLLAVWRVATVFQGSVTVGDTPIRLTFGDAAAIAATKPKKARR